MKKLLGNEKGYVLLSVYFIASILTILSLAFFSRSYLFIQSSERTNNRITALNMADAGIHAAMKQLTTNSAYAGTAAFTALGSLGGYRTDICPPACNNGLAAPTDPMVRVIQSTGHAPGSNPAARAYESRPVEAYVELDTTPFEFAALGDTSLILNGTPLVDSYNSADGAYGGSNVGSDGDVASDGAMSFIGNPTVNGAQISNPKFNCTPATTDLPSSGDLRINGSQDYQLQPGTYHFDSINITGNGKLTLLGPVTIYVDGDVYIGGNGVATSGNTPVNFMMFATQSSRIEVAGNGEFHGAIYAPASNVYYTGTGDIYGAVIGETYQQSGTSELHYDVALKDVTAPCVQVRLLSWRESTPVLQG